MIRWRVLRVVVLGAAVCLMAVLVARLGPGEILGQLRSAGPAAAWMLVIYAIGTMIGGLPWYVLLPRAARPGLAGAVVSRFAASGANAILPLLGFGGEPVRLLWIRAPDRALGIAAIVVDRMIYAVASALFLLAGVVAVTRVAQFPRSFVLLGALGGGVLLLLTVIAVRLLARHRIAGWIHRVIRRLRGRAAPDANALGATVDDAIEQIVAHRRPLAKALVLHLLGRILLGAEIYAGFAILDLPLAWDVALVFATVPVLLSFIGAIVPSQIGIQESTQALVATALGVSPVVAVAVVLLQRIRQLITATMGWGLIAVARSPGKDGASRPAASADPVP